MDMQRIDLNLLGVLRAVYATRSVSKAGQRLGMTQSAVSNALRRLRVQVGDPLFVRAPEGMMPTAFVESIIETIETGLNCIEVAVASRRQFDPATSDRLYRFLVNDLAQLVFIPPLLKCLARLAPNVRIETIDASFAEGQRAMQEGSVDLAIGNWQVMGASYFRQRLFSETFVVLMSRRHGLYRRTLTKADYLKARHVDYRPGGATYLSLQQTLDRLLSQERLKRHVAITAGHALGLASIIAESDLLLTLPSRLAVSMTAGLTTLGVKPLPFSSPALSITQQWHARLHHDAANAWMRRLIAKEFSAA